MTAFFDSISSELRSLSKEEDTFALGEKVTEIEVRLIEPCLITSQSPDFPEKYRKMIEDIVFFTFLRVPASWNALGIPGRF